MKVAIPTADGKLCMHFGHCEQFAVFSVNPQTKQITSRDVLNPPPHEPGLLPRWLQAQGVNVVIAGGMGQRAQQLLQESGINVVVGVVGEAPEEIVAAWLNGVLKTSKNVCAH